MTQTTQESRLLTSEENKPLIFQLAKLMYDWKVPALTILGFFTVVGFVAALVIERTYSYSATIEIGQRNERESIELAPAVAAKINESYIPMVESSSAARFPEHAAFYQRSNLRARVPKDTNLVILEMTAYDSEAERSLQLIGEVLSLTKDEHKHSLDMVRAASTYKVSQETQKKRELEDSMKGVEQRLERAGNLERLYTKQLTELERSLKDSVENRRKASERAGQSESSAMTLMLIDNDIESTRQRFHAIEKMLYFDLKNERDSLEKQLADLKRAISLQDESINQAQLGLAAIRETRALVPPMKSLKPKAPGRTLIVLMFAFTGALIAFFYIVVRYWGNGERSSYTQERQ